jgi:hypothetical protein
MIFFNMHSNATTISARNGLSSSCVTLHIPLNHMIYYVWPLDTDGRKLFDKNLEYFDLEVRPSMMICTDWSETISMFA